MKVSRREVLLAASAATAMGQAPPTPANPEVQTARAQMQASAQVIAQVKLPMTVEPAFRFRA